ncbi:MAG: hypothetical protein WA691_07400 [Thermoplasmata archaeon]
MIIAIVVVLLVAAGSFGYYELYHQPTKSASRTSDLTVMPYLYPGVGDAPNCGGVETNGPFPDPVSYTTGNEVSMNMVFDDENQSGTCGVTAIDLGDARLPGGCFNFNYTATTAVPATFAFGAPLNLSFELYTPSANGDYLEAMVVTCSPLG